MKTKNELTFGTKISDALHLATVLAGIEKYKAPRETETLEQYQQLISSIQEANNASAASKEVVSLATEEKQQLFFKHEKSIRNLLTPIHAAVKAQYGFSSRETSDVSAKVRSMRGGSSHKRTVTDAKAVTDGSDKTISTSHLSTGSIAQNFADMIAAIGELKPAFDPANPELAIDSLQQKYAQLIAVGSKMSNGRASLHKSRTKRNSQYAELKDRTRRIKASIKSQYGVKSSEYQLIKSITV